MHPTMRGYKQIEPKREKPKLSDSCSKSGRNTCSFVKHLKWLNWDELGNSCNVVMNHARQIDYSQESIGSWILQ